MKRPKKLCTICKRPKKEGCERCAKKPFEGISRENQQFYSSTRWRKLSKSIRRKEPLCRMCLKEDRITACQMVDHIIPIDKGGDKWDMSNLQPLCNKCHNKKTSASKKS